jgi:hypothetical protein
MGMRRWIPAFARMTGMGMDPRMREDDGKSQMDPRMREDDGKKRRHSRSVPSFLRRQESIPVCASGVTGKKMDPRVREDDAKKIYQLHSVPSTASRLTGR